MRPYWVLKLWFGLFLVLILVKPSQSQSFFNASDTLNKKRVYTVVAGEIALYTSSMYGLYHLWYKEYSTGHFHWFNDNKEWLQMDKVGHGVTGYYLTEIGTGMMRWSGVKDNKSLLAGNIVGFTYLSSIEFFDGISNKWGASYGDLIANGMGMLLYSAQDLIWKQQKIRLKYSYFPTQYPQYRPEALGHGFSQEMLKDYNGQAYWASINLKSFVFSGKEKFPKWLNLAVGYGIDGVLGGTQNPMVSASGVAIPYFERNRELLLSLDIDLSKIHTRSPFINQALKTLNFIKIPFPTVVFSDEQINFKIH